MAASEFLTEETELLTEETPFLLSETSFPDAEMIADRQRERNISTASTMNTDAVFIQTEQRAEVWSVTNEEIVEQIQNGVDVAANQEKLIERNKGYVWKVVQEFCGYGSDRRDDFEDYLQEGYIGLLTAATKYKFREGGANFLTCATYYIRGTVIRYWENFSTAIRIPTYMRELLKKYLGFRQRYKDEHGREPSREEIRAVLGLSFAKQKRLEITIRNMQMASIDKNTNDGDGDPLAELLQSDEDIEELITQSVYHKELEKALDEALNILNPRTRMAIQSIFYQGRSYDATAKLLGCSKQMVSDRIHRGFYEILNSRHRKELETFMWEGYRYNPYTHSEGSDEVYGSTDAGKEDMEKERIETEDNDFLV